jgi:hypothetical protein
MTLVELYVDFSSSLLRQVFENAHHYYYCTNNDSQSSAEFSADASTNRIRTTYKSQPHRVYVSERT